MGFCAILSDKFNYVSEVLAAYVIRPLMMEALSPSITSINFYQVARGSNPEVRDLCVHVA